MWLRPPEQTKEASGGKERQRDCGNFLAAQKRTRTRIVTARLRHSPQAPRVAHVAHTAHTQRDETFEHG